MKFQTGNMNVNDFSATVKQKKSSLEIGVLKADFSAVFALFLPIFQATPFIKSLLNGLFVPSIGG